MSDWSLAAKLLERFEGDVQMRPSDAEGLIGSIFRACGHPVVDTGFIESERGADLFIETKLDGELQRIAVEVKYRGGPVDEGSIHQLLAFRDSEHVHRSMVVSRNGFTARALDLARANGVGLVDLVSPRDLRNWLAKFDPQAPGDPSAEHIIRTAMRGLARRIAEVPAELAMVSWLDLERVLREFFEGLGFDTQLTRPAKDGGFDLELTISTEAGKATYLVEVKHWSIQKPGLSHLRKLVQVTASQSATAGLLLSTSGFTRPVYEGLAEITAPIHVGGGDKIVSLCKTYHRLHSPIWQEDRALETTLFEDTLPQAGMKPLVQPAPPKP